MTTEQLNLLLGLYRNPGFRTDQAPRGMGPAPTQSSPDQLNAILEYLRANQR